MFKPKSGAYGDISFIGDNLVRKVSKQKLNNKTVYDNSDLLEAIFYSCIKHPFIGKIRSIRFGNSIELIINKYEEIHKDKIQNMRFIEEAAVILKYVHFYNITHRDLKPPNILIDKEGSIKIIDWGLVGFGKKTSDIDCYFTVWYRPMEMLEGKTGDSVKGDVWGIAMSSLFIYYDFVKYVHFTIKEKEIENIIKGLLGKENPSIDKMRDLFDISPE